MRDTVDGGTQVPHATSKAFTLHSSYHFLAGLLSLPHPGGSSTYHPVASIAMADRLSNGQPSDRAYIRGSSSQPPTVHFCRLSDRRVTRVWREADDRVLHVRYEAGPKSGHQTSARP